MITNEHLLVKVKTTLRIKHNALDEDINDSIVACLADLKSVGILERKLDIAGELDPLILRAIKCYCKAEYTDDPTRSACYRESYDTMKANLMMAEDYGYEEEEADE